MESARTGGAAARRLEAAGVKLQEWGRLSDIVLLLVPRRVIPVPPKKDIVIKLFLKSIN